MFSPSMSRFMTGWLGTEYFLAACLALFIVDKAGRRNLMMWCAGKSLHNIYLPTALII